MLKVQLMDVHGDTLHLLDVHKYQLSKVQLEYIRYWRTTKNQKNYNLNIYSVYEIFYL